MGSLSAGELLDRVRRPEYTGDNRCLPCTATNLVIAVAVTVGLGYGLTVADAGPTVAVGVASAVFLSSLAAIYLRGYLVPGTPTVTKRYAPDWLLRPFGKATEEPAKGEVDADVDVEAVLLEARVIEPKSDGDLGLTPGFEEALFEGIATERANETNRDALAGVVGVNADTLSFQSYADGAFVAFSDGERVGSWESRAAFLADVAAGRLLPDRVDDWDDASPAERGAVLGGIRLFLERCPDCDGPVRFGQEVVESCCRTHDVVAVTCEDCDARLFEVQVTEEMLADDPGSTV